MDFNSEFNISHIIGIAGLLGLFVSYRQLVSAQRSNRAKLIIELSSWFTANSEESKFFYRLDYTNLSNSFVFDANKFPGSEDEHHLDALLYKLSHIGALVRYGAIRIEDLGWLRSIANIILRNTQVHSYLYWLRAPNQMFDHTSFIDAVYLFERLHRGAADDPVLASLKRYCVK